MLERVLGVSSNGHGKHSIKCNYCKFEFSFAKNAHKVDALSDKCGSCDSSLVHVLYFHDSPFPNGVTARTACMFCDNLLKPLIVLLKPVEAITETDDGTIEKKKKKRGKKKSQAAVMEDFMKSKFG